MSEKPCSPFWPVGMIESRGQVVAELRMAGQRMALQSGVMKDWAERFFALADALDTHSRPERK